MLEDQAVAVEESASSSGPRTGCYLPGSGTGGSGHGMNGCLEADLEQCREGNEK